MISEPAWWRYRDEPDALRSIAYLLWTDAGCRLDPAWCYETARDIEAHLREAA